MIILALTVWFWFDSISVRETAVNLGRDIAERCNLQLLDETVACSKLRIGRNARGHIKLLRTYDFEVSASGGDRLPCTLIILGKQLQSWHVPPYLQTMH